MRRVGLICVCVALPCALAPTAAATSCGSRPAVRALADGRAALVDLRPHPASASELERLAAGRRAGALRRGPELATYRLRARLESVRRVGAVTVLTIRDRDGRRLRAELPAPRCVPTGARRRAAVLAARTALFGACGGPLRHERRLAGAASVVGVGLLRGRGRLALGPVLAIDLHAACRGPSGDPPPPPPPPPTPPIDPQPSFPIRAAFYYPWFPETFGRPAGSFTHYHPTLGWYASAERATVLAHVAAMQYANVDAGIISWWGASSRLDARVPAILGATDAAGSAFRWSLYMESEGQGDPSPGAIATDLGYVRSRYGSDPSFLRDRGRPVVFVYGEPGDGCEMVRRWVQGEAGLGIEVVLKVFPGYRSCVPAADGWHQYAPATAVADEGADSYSVSPGFWKAGGGVVLARNITRFAAEVRAMAASRARWQLVTTFNEWGEGTAVESAQEWATGSGYGAYLDAVHAAP